MSYAYIIEENKELKNENKMLKDMLVQLRKDLINIQDQTSKIDSTVTSAIVNYHNAVERIEGEEQ